MKVWLIAPADEPPRFVTGYVFDPPRDANGEAMKRNVDLLDVVELRKARGSQPAGAVGAVVELFATEALIEIADKNGVTIELLSVRTRSFASDRPSRPGVAPPGSGEADLQRHRAARMRPTPPACS